MSSNLNADNFARFLSALDPDPDRAGIKYEQLRARLIRFFMAKSQPSAEDLADEVINRVVKKIDLVEESYDVGRFSHRLAQLILMESGTMPEPPKPDPAILENDERQHELQCFDQCMERLSQNDRDLMLGYYQGSGESKIEHRKALAQEMGLTLNALRIYVHRIKQTLETCIAECRKQQRRMR